MKLIDLFGNFEPEKFLKEMHRLDESFLVKCQLRYCYSSRKNIAEEFQYWCFLTDNK